jgi:hypothetical protein
MAPEAVTGPERGRLPWRAIAIVAAAAATLAYVYWNVLRGEVFVLRDAVQFNAPLREFLARSLREGRVPHWYPLSGFGVPFAAHPMYGITNPVLWALGLLPVEGGYDLLAVACVAWAGVGVAAFARELGADGLGAAAAGLLFAAGGQAVSAIPNGTAPTLAWTPWVAWAAWRLAASAAARLDLPKVGVLAAMLALQLLSGEPAQLLSAMALALAVTLARCARVRAALLLAAAVACSLPLAALGLLPGLARLTWTARAAGIDPGLVGVWSLHPLRLLELVWSGVLGDAARSTGNLARVVASTAPPGNGLPSWTLSVRLGLPALALAAISARRDRRAAALLAAAGVFLLLALGTYTPVHGVFRALVPPARLARYPEKHFAQVALLVSALAGAGLAHLRRSPSSRRGIALAAAAVGALAIAVAAARLSAPSLASAVAHLTVADRGAPLDVTRALGWAFGRGALEVALAAAFVAALAATRTARFREHGVGVAFAVLVAGAAADSAHLVVTAPKADAFARPRVADLLPSAAGQPPRRLWNWGASARGGDEDSGPAYARYLVEETPYGVAARSGVAIVPQFDDQKSAAMSRLRAQFRRIAPEDLLAFAGTDAALLGPGGGAPPEVLARTPRGALVFATPWARPRAFVATRWSRLSFDELLRTLALGVWDRTAVAIPDAPEPPDPAGAGGAPGPCTFDAYEPDRVRLTCLSPAPGYAVLLDEWAPGWTATVDGRPTDLLRADGLFRAVAIPAGAHAVALEYRTPWLAEGAAVSALAWTALAVTLALARRRGAGAPPAREDGSPAPAEDVARAPAR